MGSGADEKNLDNKEKYAGDDPLKITVEVRAIRDLQRKVKQITDPVGLYNANTESFLKGIIADQMDRGADIDNMITNILFGN